MRKTMIVLLAAAALLVAPMVGSGAAGAKAFPLSDCLDLVGTYLTKNFPKGATGQDAFASRSLLSFTNGGHIFFTDSGEAGGDGYSPFSDGRGSWACVGDENQAQKAVATVLDFTYPTASEPKQKIGRLDIEARYDDETMTIGGTMTLSFFPLSGDPLDEKAPRDGLVFDFTGSLVEPLQ